MSKNARVTARFLSVGLLIAFVANVAGCSRAGPKPPKTYPVKGKVLYEDGRPYGPGMIEFRSKSQPIIAIGEIQADGSFTLNTLNDREKLSGAIEGDCVVALIPPQPADRANRKGSVPMPITLPETYAIKPQQNDFAITLKGPKN